MAAESSVLVVGAGPTGLTMACDLVRRGVPCRIIDGNDGPTPLEESRALGIQARTMEVFKGLGVVDEILSRALPARGLAAYDDGRAAFHLTFDFDGLDTEFPHVYILPQGYTERALLGRLEALGGAVDRRSRLVGFEQDGEGVTATIAGPGGAESTHRSAWLVGADGARSVVRRALALDFQGGEYEERFLLADLELEWSLPGDEVAILLTPDGPVVSFPLPGGRWRLVDTTGIIVADDPAEIVARFRDLVGRHGPAGARVGAADWTSAFHLHRRVVDRYRAGRAFVAGDAAHLHSPAGGQGMNTGIQDAHNLAWKLGLVARGAAPEGLLDSYQVERRPVAQSVVENADAMTRMIALRSPLAREARDRLLGVLAEFDFVRRRVSAGASELEVGYRGSPIVAEDGPGLLGSLLPRAGGPGLRDHLDFGRGPRPGDRAPDVPIADDPPRRASDAWLGADHALLLFEGAARPDPGLADRAAAISARIRGSNVPIRPTYVPHAAEPTPLPAWPGPTLDDPGGLLHRRFGASAECLYLIRPDGYVAYRSQPADAGGLGAYLDRAFGG